MKGNKENRRKEKIWCKITYTVLESLFQMKRETIQKWIADGRLDPTNIFDIIDKFQHREKLDRRKKGASNVAR